jgi:hypothetical protein
VEAAQPSQGALAATAVPPCPCARRLPREQAGAFAALLRRLDAEGPHLGVSSYGLSVTTLEEVFLRITEQVGAAGVVVVVVDLPYGGFEVWGKGGGVGWGAAVARLWHW